MPVCIFCNQLHEELTSEHVFADWIGRCIGYTSKYSAAELITPNKHQRTLTPGNHAEQTLKILCAKCNNQWGGNLQSKTAAILKPFIMRPESWRRLSQKERTQVTRWLISFIMVRQFVHPELVTFTIDDRLHFRKTSTIPAGTHAWLGRFGGTRNNLSTWHRALAWGGADRIFITSVAPDAKSQF
jgi:hypothetical protein